MWYAGMGTGVFSKLTPILKCPVFSRSVLASAACNGLPDGIARGGDDLGCPGAPLLVPEQPATKARPVQARAVVTDLGITPFSSARRLRLLHPPEIAGT